jgi:hypothetical protein
VLPTTFQNCMTCVVLSGSCVASVAPRSPARVSSWLPQPPVLQATAVTLGALAAALAGADRACTVAGGLTREGQALGGGCLGCGDEAGAQVGIVSKRCPSVGVLSIVTTQGGCMCSNRVCWVIWQHW